MLTSDMAPAILIIGVASYFLIRNVRMLMNRELIERYLDRSPKAVYWVNKFGVEKTTELAKKYFLPAGIAVSCLMIGLGAWKLISLIQLQNM